MHYEKHYKELLAQDKNQAKSQAEKIIIEDVRYVFQIAYQLIYHNLLGLF